MSKHEHLLGQAGEQLAANRLRSLGLEMVEKIGTPVRLIPGRNSCKGLYKVVWGEKVSGDHHAVTPEGFSVLVETKTILDRNLRWSDLRPHQPERLTKHAGIGRAISLLVWVHSSGVYVLRWPVPGFAPRKSITPAQAWGLDMMEITGQTGIDSD